MIERLRAPQGAWNEDMVRVIEKVNELVDIVNGGGKGLQERRETVPTRAKAEEGVGKAQKGGNRTQTKRDAKNNNI